MPASFKRILATLLLLSGFLSFGDHAHAQAKRSCAQYLGDSAVAGLLGKPATIVDREGQHYKQGGVETFACQWGTNFPPHVVGAPQITVMLELQFAQHSSSESIKQTMLPWPTGPKIKLEKVAEYGPEGVYFQDSARNVAILVGSKGLKVFVISLDMGLVKPLPADIRSQLMRAAKPVLLSL
jgi:hypothetical protein